MHLSQINEKTFINILLVDWIEIDSENEKVNFIFNGDGENFFQVEARFQKSFINQLQAVNAGENIEGHYHKKTGDAKQ